MKIKMIFIAMLALALMLSACNNMESADESGYENEKSISEECSNTYDSTVGKVTGRMVGDFEYPKNPAEELRNALSADANERSLPMVISEVEHITFDNTEYLQITINFTENDNVGVILFSNRSINYGFEILLNDRPNPSFTVAFKDHDRPQDMVMVLTSVIKYLSPDLSLEEAERLAAMQDRTISTDGFSQPLDIGGYQIQSRYTNPFVFMQTPYFDAKLGVNVRAIWQLWNGAIEISNARYIAGREDYHLLNLSFWDAERHPEIVYGEFIVTNTWQNLCWRHGCTSVTVEVESMSGTQFSLNHDTWQWFRNPYEFGIGQMYTIFLGLQFNEGIIYAVQRTESVNFNSRGQKQLSDMISLDFVDSVRVLPEEYEGTLLEVNFMTTAHGFLCIFPVIKGQVLGGDTVWPTERYSPIWEDYTFVGWFDNPDFLGEPYTNETIIYQDTMLFPKWMYSGPGGILPRAYRGVIRGIYENNLVVGQNLLITVAGYNMNLESPLDKRFRWMPISWRLSDGTSGYFSDEVTFQASIPLSRIGEQGLYITYLEEVFDRVNWQQTGQVHEVRERLLVIQ